MDDRGRKYYHNAARNITQWSRPSAMDRAPQEQQPATPLTENEGPKEGNGWRQYTTTDARKYYHNAAANKTQWDRPAEIDMTPEQASVAAMQQPHACSILQGPPPLPWQTWQTQQAQHGLVPSEHKWNHFMLQVCLCVCVCVCVCVRARAAYQLRGVSVCIAGYVKRCSETQRTHELCRRGGTRCPSPILCPLQSQLHPNPRRACLGPGTCSRTARGAPGLYTCIHSYIHSCIHTYIQIYTYTYIHTHRQASLPAEILNSVFLAVFI